VSLRTYQELESLLTQLGGIPPYIYGDLGGTDRWVWFVLANLLALAAVCPFVGALSDLLGRRYVAIAGAGFIVLGMIVCSTAHNMNIFIGNLTLLHLILTHKLLILLSWYGISWRWCRHQRTHCSRRDF
jgi:MFS family permease